VNHINSQKLPYKATLYPRFKDKTFLEYNMMSGNLKKAHYVNQNFDKYRRILKEEEKNEYLKLDAI